MDPRPYHYEYRRPRLSNPTFQSTHLYQSLYHRGARDRYEFANNMTMFRGQNNNQRQNYDRPTQRTNDYLDMYSSAMIQKKQYYNNDSNRKIANSVMKDSTNPEMNRPNSNRSNKSNDWNIKQQRPSILASYGKNSMVEQKSSLVQERSFSGRKSDAFNGAYDRLNQFTIYQRQQKPYSIVGNYPRSTSTDLRKYPKLHLEDKLIEEGRYVPQN